MNLPDVRVYDDIQQRQGKDIVLTRVRNLWFENYEANLELVLKWGGLQGHVPLIDRAIVVGAGFTVNKNLHELEGVKVPVIACDKIAARVAKHVKPFIVTAINTQDTEVRLWLDTFNQVMSEVWGPESVKDVWLVVPVTIDPNIFSSWHGKVAFVNPLNTCDELCQQVYKDTGIDATVRGDNVGYFSVITAVALNAQEVVMVGMPYSYDNEEAVMNLTGGDHVVKVRDVTKNYVYTTLDWLDARREFILFCRDIQAQFRITFTNCSEGGVLYQPQVIRACKLGVWIAHL